MMQRRKKIAHDAGWDLWWDPYLKLWTMTADDRETQYFSSATLHQMREEVFVKIVQEI